MVHQHLHIRDLTVSYNRVPAIHHLNLDLTCGQSVGLLGPNGAGKTTLIKAIAGLLKPETGQIELHSPGHSATKEGLAYLPQRGLIDWDFPITVRGMVEMGRFSKLGGWKPFSSEDRLVVDEAMRLTNLEPLAHRQINALSGGQQQRAFLARAYAQQAHVYLLDEPFNGLDATSQAELKLVLHGMARDGKLVIVSHHDLKSVPELFDEVVLLNGELIAHGSVSEVFTRENIERTYATAVFSGAGS